MLRSVTSSLFALFMVTAFAQRGTIKVVDTDAMRLSAAKMTAKVDHAVHLNDVQRTQVSDAYMDRERSIDALNQRYARAEGMTPAQKQHELQRLTAPLDKRAELAVEHVLSADQLAKWKAATAPQ